MIERPGARDVVGGFEEAGWVALRPTEVGGVDLCPSPLVIVTHSGWVPGTARLTVEYLHGRSAVPTVSANYRFRIRRGLTGQFLRGDGDQSRNECGDRCRSGHRRRR